MSEEFLTAESDDEQLDRETRWQVTRELVQQLTNSPIKGGFQEYTRFIYHFISYNAIYSYLKISPLGEFTSSHDAVNISVDEIRNKYPETYIAPTLAPCYLGHEKTVELLKSISSEIDKIIGATQTQENPTGRFRIFLKGKGPSGFWLGRATNDAEHIEVIQYYLKKRPTLPPELVNKLNKTDGQVTDALFCETVLALIYQVRCNLFHASKKQIDKQELILSPMTAVLNKLINEILIKIEAS